MTVLGGLQWYIMKFANQVLVVSIPMTVLGGLQFHSNETYSFLKVIGFNTDDGIRRAAIPIVCGCIFE